MHEKHAYRLIRDLFDHKEAIFGELKRASALSHTPSGGNASKAARTRAISTDESNRRANMEERNRAIASKSRNSSPAPQANGPRHRRDRSIDPPSTRFPIHTSPPSSDSRKTTRTSLEVPSENGVASTKSANAENMPHEKGVQLHDGLPASTVPALGAHQDVSAGAQEPVSSTFAETRTSLGQRSSRFPPRRAGGGSLTSNRLSSGTSARESLDGGTGNTGVQLSDRPMDD